MLDSNENGNPYEHFIKPTVFCYEDFQQKKGWKAEIDVRLFVELCDALVGQFS